MGFSLLQTSFHGACLWVRLRVSVLCPQVTDLVCIFHTSAWHLIVVGIIPFSPDVSVCQLGKAQRERDRKSRTIICNPMLLFFWGKCTMTCSIFLKFAICSTSLSSEVHHLLFTFKQNFSFTGSAQYDTSQTGQRKVKLDSLQKLSPSTWNLTQSSALTYWSA